MRITLEPIKPPQGEEDTVQHRVVIEHPYDDLSLDMTMRLIANALAGYDFSRERVEEWIEGEDPWTNSERRLKEAEIEGLSSQLLEVQKECTALRLENEALQKSLASRDQDSEQVVDGTGSVVRTIPPKEFKKGGK